MRNLFFRSASPSPSNSPSRSTIPPSSPRHSFSDSLMEENIEIAQTLIMKWDSSDASSYTKLTSLFYDNRQEAKLYLKCVRDLQSAMHHFVNSPDSSAEKLITAQTLMQTAMKRLEKEFYQILSDNRENLDAETVSSSRSSESRASPPRTPTRSSVSDLESESEDESTFLEGEQIATIPMEDLKSIADCMISAGYGKECVKIYKIIRKSIVDEGLYHLGVEKLSLSQVQKMNWNVLETKIKYWLNAVKVAVKNLFYGERMLCHYVFSASNSVRESCFSEISKEAAMTLFGFPELVAKCKKSPEKMFRTLDLYQAISDLWPEIESIFSFESSSAVRSLGVNSLIKLGEAVRTMLEDFEAAIQKDHSKTAVPAGGVHPLTRYVMNYITFLTDYTEILADIFADYPLTLQTPLPEAYFGCYDVDESPISVRIAWLVLVLLCKLDGKAELYKDVALSYLFLANNLQYVVAKVRNSNLKYLLGDYWVGKHESKVKQYADNYERMGWSKVYASLPENPTAEISSDQAKKYFKQFNAAFEEAYKKQSSWVVTDPKLRDELKVAVAKKLVPAYREFYEKHRVGLRRECGVDSLVRYAPENLDNYLSDLLYGASGAGSVSSSFSTSCSNSQGL
ncbi:putative exocyst complex component Exo70, cullin repeat-like-containing domain-containing protein [Rosa chinensis]|uniref:Exocyst subunit Exo70 family protein n=1 Tax=Rosa chinensis TaxID=74649 RepID=A0A2P6QI67_ROSCH|nr:exocyst complex component EXO70H1 [Rosa chinensis]PRQ33870.1 putative exocyst complex component Exo70, cullin repeat-like-containing domain-containing protein [Rosa chinensis]